MTDQPTEEPAWLTVNQVAERVGIAASDWRARVARNHAPPPDAYRKVDGAVQGVYLPATYATYMEGRRVRLNGPGTTPGIPDTCGKLVDGRKCGLPIEYVTGASGIISGWYHTDRTVDHHCVPESWLT